MSELDKQGRRLLALLVKQLSSATAGRPNTYITYSRVHEKLGLTFLGPTYGESLKRQGLTNLADWTASQGRPGITGLIIEGETLLPGKGYFRLFDRTPDDFDWWNNQIQLSKEFDWSRDLEDMSLRDPPVATDVAAPPSREPVTIYRILRDTRVSKRVKALHGYTCQLCGHSIVLPDGSKYAEAHHIRPLGAPHNGLDVEENVLCLCPNHHAEVDLRVRPLALSELKQAPGHSVDAAFIDYHNEEIYGDHSST